MPDLAAIAHKPIELAPKVDDKSVKKTSLKLIFSLSLSLSYTLVLIDKAVSKEVLSIFSIF